MSLDIKQQIARRAAVDLLDGSYVNLGIGLPTPVADCVPSDREVVFHSENGLLGVGPAPEDGTEDPDLINAGKIPITLLPGASIFHHTDSFMMIRGGHIDFALLGAYQVSADGDLANWATDRETKPPGVGGAMDLAVGAREVWVLMEHSTKEGKSRLVERCSYPLTAEKVVKRIYTELALFEVREGLVVTELAPSVTFEEVCKRTSAPLRLELRFPVSA